MPLLSVIKLPFLILNCTSGYSSSDRQQPSRSGNTNKAAEVVKSPLKLLESKNSQSYFGLKSYVFIELIFKSSLFQNFGLGQNSYTGLLELLSTSGTNIRALANLAPVDPPPEELSWAALGRCMYWIGEMPWKIHKHCNEIQIFWSLWDIIIKLNCPSPRHFVSDSLETLASVQE